MKIYFCEMCGASVPLQEVVAGRATASNGRVYCAHHMPGAADGDLKLYFCDSCGVSIPLQDVITGTASADGDRTLCTECGRKEAVGDTSGDRFRLHFCDGCNTSIPQSHVVTGRALVRGGRTYCENCKDRATRRLSPVIPVLGVVVLAAVAIAMVFVFNPGAARDDAPDPVKLLGVVEKEVGDRIVDLDRSWRESLAEADQRLAEAREAFSHGIGKLEAQVTNLTKALEDRKALAEKIGHLEAEVSRLKPLEGRVAKLVNLRAEVERLREALKVSQRAPVGRAEPAPEPAVAKNTPVAPAENQDAPEAVRQRIDRLKSPDSGIRFSAAVELGKLAHNAAVAPLTVLLAKDEDLFVRRAAARALGEINDRTAIPALIEALMDSEIYVSLQAAKSLRSISGKEFGFKETLTASKRRQVQTKWKKWWKDNAAE
jgi:HEAT repeat protein